jgi:hypothetical protein
LNCGVFVTVIRSSSHYTRYSRPSMGTTRSLDAGTDRLPVSMRAAQGLDLSWKERSRCREGTRRAGLPQFAFTVDYGDKGALLLDRTAETWIAYALMECRNCEAQYDCARFAIDAKEKWGTWSMDPEDLRLLHKRGGGRAVVAQAELAGEPVQVAVRRRLHGRHAI